jgi:hypothetical protein
MLKRYIQQIRGHINLPIPDFMDIRHVVWKAKYQKVVAC